MSSSLVAALADDYSRVVVAVVSIVFTSNHSNNPTTAPENQRAAMYIRISKQTATTVMTVSLAGCRFLFATAAKDIHFASQLRRATDNEPPDPPAQHPIFLF